MICAIPSTLADLESAIALVPDFPKPGILFRDMSPLLAEHFPAGSGSPVYVIVPEEDLVAAVETMAASDGIESVAAVSAA